jgi:hypothetical protein
MTTLSRRRFLLAIAASVPAVHALGEVLPTGNIENPSTAYVPNYPRLAADLAELERSALESNHPRRWRTMHYTSAIQLDPESICVFGVGNPKQTAAEHARLRPFFCEEAPPLAEAFTPDRRAWTLIVPGVLSPGLRRELQRPEWERASSRTREAMP